MQFTGSTSAIHGSRFLPGLFLWTLRKHKIGNLVRDGFQKCRSLFWIRYPSTLSTQCALGYVSSHFHHIEVGLRFRHGDYCFLSIFKKGAAGLYALNFKITHYQAIRRGCWETLKVVIGNLLKMAEACESRTHQKPAKQTPTGFEVEARFRGPSTRLCSLRPANNKPRAEILSEGTRRKVWAESTVCPRTRRRHRRQSLRRKIRRHHLRSSLSRWNWLVELKQT